MASALSNKDPSHHVDKLSLQTHRLKVRSGENQKCQPLTITVVPELAQLVSKFKTGYQDLKQISNSKYGSTHDVQGYGHPTHNNTDVFHGNTHHPHQTL